MQPEPRFLAGSPAFHFPGSCEAQERGQMPETAPSLDDIPHLVRESHHDLAKVFDCSTRLIETLFKILSAGSSILSEMRRLIPSEMQKWLESVERLPGQVDEARSALCPVLHEIIASAPVGPPVRIYGCERVVVCEALVALGERTLGIINPFWPFLSDPERAELSRGGLAESLRIYTRNFSPVIWDNLRPLLRNEIVTTSVHRASPTQESRDLSRLATTLLPRIPQTPSLVFSQRPPSFVLPDGWEFSGEYSTYPNPNDIESIRQWISYLLRNAKSFATDSTELLIPDFDYPDVRNAHRIVRHLRNYQGWKNPPKEPRRKFTTTKDDLLALADELDHVKKWIDRCLEGKDSGLPQNLLDVLEVLKRNGRRMSGKDLSDQLDSTEESVRASMLRLRDKGLTDNTFRKKDRPHPRGYGLVEWP